MIHRPPRSTLFPYTTSSDLQKRLQQRYNKLTIISNVVIINQSDILAQAVQSAQEHEESKTSESSKQSITFRSSKDRKRSEEHTSELQSHSDLVCRLLLEKKK